jgi:hypothetical protein
VTAMRSTFMQEAADVLTVTGWSALPPSLR